PNGAFEAFFPISGMSVGFRWRPEDVDIFTEGLSEATWKSRASMSFKYLLSEYEACETDLNAFVDRLAESTAANFALSYEYTKLLAVRDNNGLRKFDKFG